MIESSERKGELSRWEKIKGLFLLIYAEEEITKQMLSDYEQRVVFEELDRMNMWDFLKEANEWGEMEISEDGEKYSMTQTGRERWGRFT